MADLLKRTCLVYDSRLSCHYHLWNDDFTEIPARLTEPYSVCQKYKLPERCLEINCREATEEEMKMMHSSEHVEKLRETSNMTEEELKAKSEKYDFIYFHPHSFENARLALGGTLDLVDKVLKDEVRADLNCTMANQAVRASDKVQNGMAIIRPPGHHAMHNNFCGYCYLNNVAIAAKMALDKHNLERILIVDWDVHHGQGTQYMFYDDPRVLYFSIHLYEYGLEWPCLRESDYDFIGTRKGLGYNINVPLNKTGCDNSDYMAIFQQLLLPIVYEFCPELILVSAGYDAAIGCPEGQMEVTPAMYSHFTNLLSPLAGGKICLIQEGGYCVKSLSEGIALSLKTLLGDPCPMVEPLTAPCQLVKETILNVIKVLRPYWKSLCYQDNLLEGEAPEIVSVVDWPPRPDVKFYTSDSTPESFSIFQDCYNPGYEQKKEGLLKHLDLLIQNTKLTFAPNRVCIVYDERVLLHKDISSGGFEETPERVSYLVNKMMTSGNSIWARCQKVQGREASTDELCLAHSLDYVNKIQKMTSLSDEAVIKYQSTFKSIYLCQNTYQSAAVAAGSCLNIIDNVMTGKAQAGVAVVRPPGHHADKNDTMGFCIFNTVGIAAKYAQTNYNLKRYPNMEPECNTSNMVSMPNMAPLELQERKKENNKQTHKQSLESYRLHVIRKALNQILIVDWDIHHGNGIQRLFYEDPGVLYISVHRSDNGYYYPYGGDSFINRVGSGKGEGFNVNLAWNGEPKNDGDYIAAFQQVVMPIAYQYCPELVLVAAGFDAGEGDPMGRYHVTPACFGHLTHMLKSLANGKIILSLEGGYNNDTVADCLSMCVSDLLGDPCPSLASLKPTQRKVKGFFKGKRKKGLQLSSKKPSTYKQMARENISEMISAAEDIKRCLDVQKKYWSCLQYRVKLPTEEQLKTIREAKEKSMSEGKIS